MGAKSEGMVEGLMSGGAKAGFRSIRLGFVNESGESAGSDSIRSLAQNKASLPDLRTRLAAL